jgi:hypothetical protein
MIENAIMVGDDTKPVRVRQLPGRIDALLTKAVAVR